MQIIKFNGPCNYLLLYATWAGPARPLNKQKTRRVFSAVKWATLRLLLQKAGMGLSRGRRCVGGWSEGDKEVPSEPAINYFNCIISFELPISYRAYFCYRAQRCRTWNVQTLEQQDAFYIPSEFPIRFCHVFISFFLFFMTLFSINYFMVYFFVSIFHFQSDFSMLFCLFSRFFRRCGSICLKAI